MLRRSRSGIPCSGVISRNMRDDKGTHNHPSDRLAKQPGNPGTDRGAGFFQAVFDDREFGLGDPDSYRNIAPDLTAPTAVRARALWLARCEEKLGVGRHSPSSATRSTSPTA